MADYEYTIGKEVDLKKEQEITLASPRLKSNLFLKAMYLTADIFYGKKVTLPKVKVIEILARYPYWAWENGSYLKMTKIYANHKKVSKADSDQSVALINLGREAQDNEELHLLLVEELIHQKGIKLGWFNHCVVPRLLAFGYYFLTRMIYCVKPSWSFAMNAAFESHAEHEYMSMIAAHPEWDEEKIDLVNFDRYPEQKTLGDLIRRIALDERDHMNHSLEMVEKLK